MNKDHFMKAVEGVKNAPLGRDGGVPYITVPYIAPGDFEKMALGQRGESQIAPYSLRVDSETRLECLKLASHNCVCPGDTRQVLEIARKYESYVNGLTEREPSDSDAEWLANSDH